MLFGFLLKRARFCPTGIIRDIYLEKRKYNVFIILAIIFTEGFIYHILASMELVPEPHLLMYSITSVILGGLMFGFGAVMTSGCITATLVKCGDGRVIGIISLLSFILTSYMAVEGPLSKITTKLQFSNLVNDSFLEQLPFSPILFCAIA